MRTLTFGNPQSVEATDDGTVYVTNGDGWVSRSRRSSAPAVPAFGGDGGADG